MPSRPAVAMASFSASLASMSIGMIGEVDGLLLTDFCEGEEFASSIFSMVCFFVTAFSCIL